MNIQEMIRSCNRLIAEWEEYAHSPDAMGRLEWCRGVLHGLRLMLKHIHNHIDIQR